MSLAQNLPGRKLVDLRQYAYVFFFTSMQSSNRETTFFNVHMSHYWYICVFSVCLLSETNTIIEKIDFIHKLPFANAACWNCIRGISRCNKSSWMSRISKPVSWMMLNIVVCKQKSISRTVFEKWELEKCCVRSVIQCRPKSDGYKKSENIC